MEMETDKEFVTITSSIMISVIFVLLAIVTPAKAETEGRTWHIKGIAITGPNDVCGEPQWQIPEPFPPDAHFTILGKYDPTPGATDAIPLSPHNCNESVLLATHPDPELNVLGGFPDADPRLKNVPLRDVSIVADIDGVRSPLPSMGIFPPNPFPPTKSEPSDPITLGDWLSASGKMSVRCLDNGSASVNMSFSHLIPNGVYSVVATWLSVPPGTVQPTFVPLAFGGVPNAIVADEKGRAHFKRHLNYCPMDPTPDGSVIMFLDVGYHADATTDGAFPTAVNETAFFLSADGGLFESFQPPGVVTIPHVGFPMVVKPLHQNSATKDFP